LALPGRLQFSIGGYLGESFSIELRDGVLEYKRFSPGYNLDATETFSPTPAAWETWLTAADQLEVWSWLPSYDIPVVDGTSWHLQLEHGGRVADSRGSNGYPGDADLTTSVHAVSARFRALLEALSHLVGGRPIH
jgi:hypothetical protein